MIQSEKHIQIILDGITLAEVPEWIQLIPRGNAPDFKVQSLKGEFVVDDLAVQMVLDFFNSQKNDVVIDYEHQTLTGQKAPAAGWIKQLQDRGPGETGGIWARVEWTQPATQMLALKEYRYLSPEIWVRENDRRVMYVTSAGLTNKPALDGMVPIVMKDDTKGDVQMSKPKWMETILTRLGIPVDATDDQIEKAVTSATINPTAPVTAGNETTTAVLPNQAVLDALAALTAAGKLPPTTQTQTAAVPETLPDNGQVALKAPVPPALLSLLGLPQGASEAEAAGRIMALSAGSFAATGNLAELLKKSEEDKLVDLALKAGKITPAMEPWARQQIQTCPSGFQLFLSTAVPVVPLSHIPVIQTPQGGQMPEVDAVQQMVNSQLGLSQEDFAKYGGKK